MSRLEGGKVRGWPFLYTSLAGLVRMWKISELYQEVWVYINGSVFGVRERVLLGAVHINPHSSSRTDAEIFLMFSHMQHDISEAQSESHDSGGGL